MDDDDDFSRGMSSNAKSANKGAKHNTYGDEDEEEVELRPVKPGRTFLFGAVDNVQ